MTRSNRISETRLSARLRGSALVRAAFGCKPPGSEMYIVGGYIRDTIMSESSRNPIQDLDLAVSGGARALDLALKALKHEMGGTVVPLSEDVSRLALRNGRFIDVSCFNGKITEDLSRRDFTINALAWGPETGVLDPHNGIIDMNKRVIRHISKRNLIDDPLRVLRAYRFASETGFQIDKGTRMLCKELASTLSKPANERITLEFFKLLMGNNVNNALGNALEDGVLERIIPLNIKMLEDNIQLVSSVAEKIKNSPERIYFKKQGLGQEGMLRLMGLSLGADADRLRLSLGRDLARSVSAFQDNYDTIRTFDVFAGDDAMNDLFDIFRGAGEAASWIILLAWRNDLRKHLRRYKRIMLRPLIRAEEIMSLTGQGSGPSVGRALRRIQKARFTGEVRTRAKAERLLREPQPPSGQKTDIIIS